jgi:hypothetical protein
VIAGVAAVAVAASLLFVRSDEIATGAAEAAPAA